MSRFAPPADARVFLGRLTHLDAAAVVRLRPASAGRTALWARLPWAVLVTREVDGEVDEDVTVAAADLLHGDDAPPRRDVSWRWPLPPHPGTVVERVPAPRLREVAAAAAGTLRQVTESGLDGRAVGVRVLRESLLDHVAVVVHSDEAGRLEVPQRLVQGAVRMGFLGSGDRDGGGAAGVPEEPVGVRLADGWVGLSARYGTAWLSPPDPLTLRPLRPGR